MNREITARELQMLSEYLDGMLPEKERIQVEARLRSNPEYLEELEGLRRTHLLLQQLPKRRAPRNFFITPEMVPKRPSFQLFPVFRLAAAVAALLLVVVFAGDLFSGTRLQTAAPKQAFVTQQVEASNATGLAQSNAPIIVWGTPTSSVGFGLGGGGGAEGSGLTGIGGGSGQPFPPTEAAIAPETTPAPGVEGTPAPTEAQSKIAAEPSAEATAPAVQALAPQVSRPSSDQAPGAARDQYQSGPVLGINPTQGAADAEALEHPRPQPIELPRSTLHIIEGVLGGLVVLAGLAAFFFHRRESL